MFLKVMVSMVCTHPQAVDTFKRISALLGLPLALPPALPARSVGSVGGCVWALCVGPALNTDSIILQTNKQKKMLKRFLPYSLVDFTYHI